MQKTGLMLVLAAVLTACGGGGLNDRTPDEQHDFGFAGTLLDLAVANGDIDGYSFVLVDDDNLFYEKSGGTAAGQAQDVNRPLPLASASKALAAAAIVKTLGATQSNLQTALDVPIHQFLQGTGVNWPDDAGNPKSQITLRMLLSHTSGLPGIQQDPACLDQPNLNGGLAACVAVIASNAVPLVATPGTTFIYGGADYQVAGYVAVVLAGASSWQNLFNAALAAPLGASSEMRYLPGNNPRIGGGAEASAEAYAAFLQMLLSGGTHNGATVLSAAGVTALRSNQLGNGVTTYTGGGTFNPYGPASSSYPLYGLGFFLDKNTLFPGSPGPEVSSQGLFGATPWVDFGLGYGAILLLMEDNNSSAVPQTSIDLWNQLRDGIIAELN